MTNIAKSISAKDPKRLTGKETNQLAMQVLHQLNGLSIAEVCCVLREAEGLAKSYTRHDTSSAWFRQAVQDSQMAFDSCLATNRLKTPEEARAWFDEQGISITQWCRENELNHSLVNEILAGRKKCSRGQSHNIAVLLGMKHGALTTRPGRVTPVRHAVQGAAA